MRSLVLHSTRVSEFRRTIGGNIADLRRAGKSGSGLSLPNLYDFARIPSIFCDPLRSMVAPRQRERMNSPHKSDESSGKAWFPRDLGSARQLKQCRILGGYGMAACAKRTFAWRSIDVRAWMKDQLKG